MTLNCDSPHFSFHLYLPAPLSLIHIFLTAYIKNTLSGYPRLEDQNLDDLTVELLYPTDEAAEHCIKEFLALRLDDDNEHELEQ